MICWRKGLGAHGPYPFPQTPIPNPISEKDRGTSPQSFFSSCDQSGYQEIPRSDPKVIIY